MLARARALAPRAGRARARARRTRLAHRQQVVKVWFKGICITVDYRLQITDYSLLQVLTVLPFKQHVLETAKRPFPLVRLGLRV